MRIILQQNWCLAWTLDAGVFLPNLFMWGTNENSTSVSHCCHITISGQWKKLSQPQHVISHRSRLLSMRMHSKGSKCMWPKTSVFCSGKRVDLMTFQGCLPQVLLTQSIRILFSWNSYSVKSVQCVCVSRSDRSDTSLAGVALIGGRTRFCVTLWLNEVYCIFKNELPWMF